MRLPGKLVFNPKRFVPPLVLGVLSVGYMIVATGFDDPTSMAAPLLYGTALVALSLVVLGTSFFPSTDVTSRPGRTAQREEGGFQWRPTAFIFLVTGLFIVVVFLAGFYVAIPLFLFLFIKYVSKTGWLGSIVISLTALFFTWAVFSYFLHLDVYPGFLNIRI